MEIVYHLGVHCTDEDALLRSLRRNAESLASEGVVVPDPARFRPVLREALINLRGSPASAEMQATMLDAVTDEDGTERVIFSNENFFCAPARAITGGRLYPMAGARAGWLRNLFPDAEIEFFISLRNPATLLPALSDRVHDADFNAWLKAGNYDDLRWSDVINALREGAPNAALTVWCNEDAPMIWPELVDRLALVGDGTSLKGRFDILSGLMKPGGVERLEAYLASHPVRNAAQRTRIISAFLDKFVRPGAVEMEIDLKGWDENLVARLTDDYERDVDLIRNMDGVTFVAP
ncbi:hypothetical protein ATO2_11935 [Roseovarius sp. 22II1-1F6A]|nr:hypothetical protein ATO2_11935 [Roseovarius sp. 22II1-1F6A]